MKKTFTINISGTVFHIDDDAHEKLNNYLIKLTRYFGTDPDAKEIVQDIESRISELFSQRLKDGSEVITIEHVEEIIQIMGMPEAFTETNEEKKEEPKIVSPRAGGKKLYRDPDNRVLGGVCSGLGAYFDIDPVFIRLIFVLLFFFGVGSSFLIYVILWIVVPKARNIAQRLEMKGEEVNVNNISKSIKEEIQDVKDNYDKFRKSKTYSKGREQLSDAGNVLLSILRAFAKIFVVIFGVVLVIISIALIVAFIVSLFVSHEFIGISPFSFLDLHLFANGGILSWVWVGIALLVGVPLIFLTYLGLKLIFRFKPLNGAFSLSFLGLWLLGVVILIGATISGVGGFRRTSTNTKQEILPTRSDTLYLKLGKDEFSDYLSAKFDIGRLRVASMNDKDFLVGIPRFTIERSESNDFNVIIKTKANGHDLNNALANARDVVYKYDQQDSLVTFQPWFMIPSKSSWHAQEINIFLKIPLNKTVYLSDDMVKIISDIKNTSNTWDGDMVGKYWTMKPEGLELAQRKPAPLQINKKTKK
jgi:phage shock protein PspC (stress-responsive transcriptional regulator)